MRKKYKDNINLLLRNNSLNQFKNIYGTYKVMDLVINSREKYRHIIKLRPDFLIEKKASKISFVPMKVSTTFYPSNGISDLSFIRRTETMMNLLYYPLKNVVKYKSFRIFDSYAKNLNYGWCKKRNKKNCL